MRNKPMQISYATISANGKVTGDSADIIKLKQILSDGYVVTIPTLYDTFEWTLRTSNGEPACKSAKIAQTYEEEDSGHALTVVGYDDGMWIDINNNRQRDDGEYGAFKIANSWGLNGDNCYNGCFWLAYDAIGKQSSVTGVSSVSKDSAFEEYYLIQPKVNYEPLYVANVQMTASDRNQVSVQIGVSSADKTTPDKTLSVSSDYNIAFYNANKTLLTKNKNITIYKRTFSGKTKLAQGTVTIPFDITPVIKSLYSRVGMTFGKPIKIYITVGDNIDDKNYVYLKNVSIIETATGEVTNCLDTNSLKANNSSITKTVDFTPRTFVGSYHAQDLTLSFNNDILPSTITEQTLYASDYQNAVLTFDVKTDDKSIVVQPNNDTGLFVPDSVYHLTVGGDIRTKGGNPLGADIQVPIYILDRYYEWCYDEKLWR